jgi:uncharacterized iron-regulated protein
MKFLKISLVLVIMTQILAAQDKPAYAIYDSKGKEVSYSKMLRQLAESDFVFFGESHNNSIAHWMELELTKDLYAKHGKDLILGAEMFEADNQLVLDEYLASFLTDKRFEDETRLWKNYATDYKPLVLFAKENGLKMVASNVPRRYAGLVSDKGFEGLDAIVQDGKKFMVPLPFPYDSTLACYKDMLTMQGGHGSTKMNQNFPKAQALKDATMADFILKNWTKGKVFLHYNGSYHSDKHQGIVWYIMQQKPDSRILTISTVSQKDISKLEEESKGLADFILVVPEDMTNTY